MTGVKNRVALVTGAGSADGIGFATAKLLLEAGAKVAITSTTERIYDRLNDLNGSLDKTFAKPADLTDCDQVTALLADIETNLGPIDIVVNNAGMVQVGKQESAGHISQMSNESWSYGLDINLTSAFYVTRGALDGMIKRNYGRIIHMSSVTGPVVGIAGSSVYAAAKAGMLGMARSLAIEVGAHNITVNCIGPGWIKTSSSDDAEIIAGKYTPIGRPGTPEEVGHATLFLASEEASYITGQILVVDGGNTIQEYKVSL